MPRRATALALAAAAAFAAAACGDSSTNSESAAPRGPLPSTHAHQEGVKLPGDVVTRGVGGECRACHEDVEARYAAVGGMHRSLTLPSGEGSIEAGLVGAKVADPESGAAGSFELRDGRYVQRIVYVDPSGVERAAFEMPVDLVVGSGRAGRAYLTVRGARVFELPLVWDVRTRALAFSPRWRSAESMAAPVDRRCLECHTGDVSGADAGRWAHAFAGSLSLGVTCRRCHGDAPEHARTKEPADVVHPARLDLARQDELCAQCHLAGISSQIHRGKSLSRDFRPGVPLGSVLGVFRGIAPQDEPSVAHGTAGYAERLRLSRCATASGAGGRPALVCTTCHDPHPSADAAARSDASGRCVTCHDCKTPAVERAGKRCAECHMARPAGDAIHPRSTDHFIRRAPPDAPSAAEPPTLAVMAQQNRPIENVFDPTAEHPGSKALAAAAHLDGSITARAAFGESARGYVVRAREHLDALPDDDRNAAFLRGLERFEAGDSVAGEAAFRRYVQQFGAEPDATRYVLWATYDQGRWKEAADGAAGLVAEDPYDELAGRILTASLNALRRPDEAVSVLAALRERLGPSAERALQMLDASVRARDLPHTLEAAYDLLLFRPKDPESLAIAAHALAFEAKDRERARGLFHEALRIGPDTVTALVGLALLEDAAGNRSEARRHAERAEAIQPGIQDLQPILRR